MSKLNDLALIKSLDQSNMADLIINLPEQIYRGYNETIVHQPSVFLGATAGIRHIVICGMGGSAISADIAKVMFEGTLPITVVKDFRLPHIDDHTLVIVISYSGNTAESIECLKIAKAFTRYVSVITCGGQIAELITLDKLWIQLPTGFPPRAAIGYLFFSLIRILELYKIIPSQKDNIEKLIKNMISKAPVIYLDTETSKNIAKNTASKIYQKIPIIYSSNPTLAPVAYRWKCQINENAKYPAFSHTFPEMLHNEIEGWETMSNVNSQPSTDNPFIPIFLCQYNQEQHYEKAIKSFQTLLRQQNITYLEFYTDHSGNPYNLFLLIYLGDMISYYLGILNNVDPTAIEYINYIKKS